MTAPGSHNFEIYRGTTDPFVFRLKIEDLPDNPGTFLPMPLTDLRLTIKAGSDTPVTYSLENDDFVLTSAPDGEYTFVPTAAQTRLLKAGVKADGTGKNTYELEIRDAGATPPTQMVYLTGVIIARGGLNDDD